MDEVGIPEGKLVRLRPVQLEDCSSAYLGWLNDPLVTAGLETVAQPYTSEMLEAYIRQTMGTTGDHLFMILEKETGTPIGTVRIHHVHSVHGTCHLGLMIGDKSRWGQGLGSDVLETAVRYAFNQLGVRKICESINASNTASLSIFRRLGFQEEGILKQQVRKGTSYEDKILVALFAQDWKKR